ncbi:MAG: DUF2846 domain-containing protein [Pyrinomonadaceae bacterium]
MAFVVLTVAQSIKSQLVPVEEGTIFVYMPHHTWTSGRFSGKVYVDEKKTAEISKNRYFVLHLAPGKHSFYVRDKKLGGIDIDVAKGATYYLKINVDEGGYRVKFRGVSVVPLEEGEFAIKQIQPIKKGDIYDESFVDMKVVSIK